MSIRQEGTVGESVGYVSVGVAGEYPDHGIPAAEDSVGRVFIGGGGGSAASDIPWWETTTNPSPQYIPRPQAEIPGLARINRCSSQIHYFACKHEEKCECGQTSRVVMPDGI